MASILRDSNGRKKVQVMVPSAAGRKSRKRIALGKLSERKADAIKTQIEHLTAAIETGQPLDPHTSEWLAKIGPDLHARLAAAGLVTPRRQQRRENPTLADFTATYISGRHDLKPLTGRNLQTARKRLIAFFGPDKLLLEVTGGDADAFYQWMVGQGFAAATIGREVRRARQFYAAAIRRKLLTENPFSEVKASNKVNRDRDYFVRVETIQKVIDAAPDAQWRLLIALSRYGGLRCPSEHLALRWTDIDWEHNRFRVRSSKTEHHEGGESRMVPLFPELRPYLEDSHELAAPGTEHCITRYRDTNANLRTQLLRIIDRAGVDPWPKLFQNLRATRQTELSQRFPEHVVCKWLGNSPRVARAHYLQTTEEHFEQAAEFSVLPATASPRGQNQAHGAHGEGQNRGQPMSADIAQIFAEGEAGKGLRQTSAEVRQTLQTPQTPQAGFEPATTGLGNQCSIP